MLDFRPAGALLPALTRCASHRTPCLAAESAASTRQVRIGPLPVSLAGNQECPPPPPLPPALFFFPNGSYQTHREICGPKKAATNFPRGKRRCSNSLRLSFPSYFLHRSSKGESKQPFSRDADLVFQKAKDPPAVCVSRHLGFTRELLIVQRAPVIGQ